MKQSDWANQEIRDYVFEYDLQFALRNPQMYHWHYYENMKPEFRNHVAMAIKLAGIQACRKEFGDHVLIAILVYHPAFRHAAYGV